LGATVSVRLVTSEWAWARLLASTCATGVGLGATVSVDFCHRSELKVATVSVDFCHWSGLEVRPLALTFATGVDLGATVVVDFTYGTRTHGTEREYLGYLDPWYGA
jgi:hypothetical protein